MLNKIKTWIRLLGGYSAVAAMFVLVSFAALAQAFPLPTDVDPAQLLLSLATNWKALGVLGVISAATLLSALAVNAWVPDKWKFKRLTVLLIAMIYAALAAYMAPHGSPIASVLGVLVTGLIAKGGASELYEALKGAGIIKSKTAQVTAKA